MPVLTRIRAALLAVALGASVAACGGPSPSASVASVPLLTGAPAPAGPVACMAALLEGTLVLDGRSGIGVGVPRAPNVSVRWPNGYRAVDVPPITLLDVSGRPVARIGEAVSLGGGFGVDGIWEACPTEIKRG